MRRKRRKTLLDFWTFDARETNFIIFFFSKRKLLLALTRTCTREVAALQHATLSFCAGHERSDPSGRCFSSALHHLQTVFFLHAARESRQRGVKGQSKSFYESRIFSVFGVRIGTLRDTL